MSYTKTPAIAGQLEQVIYDEWVAMEHSASQIAHKHDLTKNIVIGHAWRRRWPPRKEVSRYPTLDERLQLHQQRFELVLETLE